jgi:cytochrome c biogenesis protein CcdA/thiol-disulfide isomerase/thioredoxin
MALLVGVAFAVGLLTALTPCVLPVLPVVLAGGATGSRRRALAIVAGLVVSFTLFTLFWTAILDALPLPEDLLRNVAIGFIALMAVSLVVPRVAELAERPLARLGRLRPRARGSGFLLGLALGLVFTPCAGLLIGTVASAAATQEYSADLVLVVLAYALGAAASFLAIMLGVQRGLALRRLRSAAPRLRQALGVLMAGVVVVMALGLDARLATKVPGFLDGALSIQESGRVADELAALAGSRGIGAAAAAAPAPATPVRAPGPADAPAEETAELALARSLPDYGAAPEFAGVQGWLNSQPLSLESLRGKVVLIDFWTYSCVNCLRTLPYLRRWHDRYADDGLVIVGVHTPEFAFEADRANVEDAVRDLGVAYAVALDPEYGTWQAWGNRYWPAKYFVDQRGHVRYAHFGEGAYEESEQVIRALLADAGDADDGGGLVASGLADLTPASEQTPETYLGYARIEGFVGDTIRQGEEKEYRLADDLPRNRLTYGGRWLVEDERAIAGEAATLRIRFQGRAVHLVLGPGRRGHGTVDVLVDGERVRTVDVDSYRLYTLAEVADDAFHLLELRFSPGVEGYAFTFGRMAAPA